MTKDPDKLINEIYNKYSSQAWLAMCACIIGGFLTHIFILTNELCNHDDIAALFQTPKGIIATRWLQSILGYLVSPFGSGVMAGGLTILILAITALLLVDTLKIESKCFSVIIGILLVATPIVSSFMSYLNGSFNFVGGIPFAILAVRWYEKGIRGAISSCLAIMVSIAGYQSNVAITIALFYVVLFTRLLDEKVEIKKWWISFVKALAILFVGLLLYLVSNHIAASLSGTGGLSGDNGYSIGISSGELTATGYAGQAEAGTLYMKQIPHTIVVAVKYFMKYHFNIFFDGANVSFASKINVLSSIILAGCILIAIINAIVKQKGVFRKGMIVIVGMLAPICINSVEIILNGKCDETLQMMYSMIMVVPLVVMILEKEHFMQTNVKNVLMNLAVFAFIVHIYGNVQIINDAYLRMNSIYESAYGEMCRIIDRVEQLPEWQEGNRTLYFAYQDEGYLINENYQAFRQVDNYIDMGWLGVFGTEVHYFWGNHNTSNFAKCYFGLDFDTPSQEQIMWLQSSNDYIDMEIFPSNKSVKIINDVIVVRMN